MYFPLNMGIFQPAMEDVFPIKHGDIPASYISLPEGIRCAETPLSLSSFFLCENPNFTVIYSNGSWMGKVCCISCLEKT